MPMVKVDYMSLLTCPLTALRVRDEWSGRADHDASECDSTRKTTSSFCELQKISCLLCNMNPLNWITSIANRW